MPEQYVFSVAFDRDIEGVNETVEQSDPEWQKLVQDIVTATNNAGLPILDNERWEEFGNGRIFWGTQTECEAVKEVLSGFPISIEEERNLETGYYTTSDTIYYVAKDGEILGISKYDFINKNHIVAKYNAIPLDAFKEQRVEPELETLFQRFLVPKVQSAAQQMQVSPDLQNRIVLQREQIEELEVRVQDLSQQLLSSQELASHKIDPSEYENLQQKSADQAGQIIQLEEAVSLLNNQLRELQDVTDRKIEPGVYEALQQLATDKDRQNAELEEQVGRLANELSNLNELANQKIDPADYETLQQTLASQIGQITQLEEAVSLLNTQLTELQDVTDRKIEPSIYEALQQLATGRDRQNAELEQQVGRLANELSHWKELANQKIDPAEHEVLLQKSADQSNQITQLEDTVSHLHNQVAELQTLADKKIEPAVFEKLQQEAASQSDRIAELEKQATDLENEVSQWTSIAAEKIDRVEHVALLAQRDTEHSQEKATLQETLDKRRSYIPRWVAGVAMLCSLAIGIAGTAAVFVGSDSPSSVSQEIQTSK